MFSRRFLLGASPLVAAGLLAACTTSTDANGNTVTVKGTDGTVYVQGTGSYTVTVTSYSTSADLSGAGTFSDWSSHAVEEPSQLS